MNDHLNVDSCIVSFIHKYLLHEQKASKFSTLVFSEEMTNRFHIQEVRPEYDAFISLAENRHTGLKHLDSSDFADKAAKAMEAIESAFQKVAQRKSFHENQKCTEWNDLRSNVLLVAQGHWRCPELVAKDSAFAHEVETLFPVIRPQSIGVKPSVLMNSFFLCAVRELRQLNNFQAPLDTIQILTNCKKIVESMSFLPFITGSKVFHGCVLNLLQKWMRM